MGYRSIRGRVGLQPLERSCFNKAFRCVAGVVLATGDRQLLCRRAIRQVEIGHLDPEGVRGGGRVEEVNLVLLVGDRPPKGGRNVGRAGRCNAERDADRAHYRDHLGGRLVGISAIWNGRDVVLVDLGRDRAEVEHQGEQLTTFSFRHRYAKAMHSANVPIANISEAMAHTIEVHLGSYARFKPNATADIIAAVDV